MFTNPLDSIRIASPCKSDWNQMYGNDRRRFCGECKMNVYNLSGMSRDEAESLLTNAEGRLCVRFYRRRDGTVLTKDCPVGWQAIKRRVSRTTTALASVLATFLAGVFSLRAVDSAISALPTGDVPPVQIRQDPVRPWAVEFVVGELDVMEGEVNLDDFRKRNFRIDRYEILGSVDNVERLEDAK